ncbi:MAG: Glu-tRNA(Gln) amidotransferase subunit GatD [Candidatus Thorarchaeota archaeon]
MSKEEYAGYLGSALLWLQNNQLEVWDEIEVVKRGSTINGVILPRNELANPEYVTLKLATGYNIGISTGGIQSVKKTGRRKGKYRVPQTDAPLKTDLPFIPILGCGGTIASRLDYETGGTIPALSPEELLSSFPEIADLAKIETRLLFELFSENIAFEHYAKVLAEIEQIIKQKKAQGIVLTHGTDTMAFTAAALSFAITNSPIPIVITGSQRSSDRPSSDSFFNLYHSVMYVSSPEAKKEVVVIMHETSSDTACSIHQATRVRKMHSSRRDTFQTIGAAPLGRIEGGKIVYNQESTPFLQDKAAETRKFQIKKKFEPMVAMFHHYPGVRPGNLEYLLENGYKGIVLVGTGLGHTSSELIPLVQTATTDLGMVIVMATQTLHGFTGMSVYETGRRLVKAGVVPVGNMLPETAYIKLSYLLANYSVDKVKELMPTNLKGEILSRERYNAFP